MKLINFQKTHDGKYLRSYELTYLNKTGKEKKYEIVSRNDIKSADDLGNSTAGVSIVATRNKKLLLLKEFRMGINRSIYNLCAGMTEKNETVEECIKRELYEETGLIVTEFRKILRPSYSSVAISDVKTQIAFVEVAGNLTNKNTSDNEMIEPGFYDAEQVKHLLDTEEFSSRAQIAAYMFTKDSDLNDSR